MFRTKQTAELRMGWTNWTEITKCMFQVTSLVSSDKNISDVVSQSRRQLQAPHRLRALAGPLHCRILWTHHGPVQEINASQANLEPACLLAVAAQKQPTEQPLAQHAGHRTQQTGG